MPTANKPLSLTDSELDAVISAARPLDVGVRDVFLQSVADALARCDVIGPGTIHRIVMEKQRQFFDPPSGHGNPRLL